MQIVKQNNVKKGEKGGWSTYVKKDGTAVTSILSVVAKKEVKKADRVEYLEDVPMLGLYTTIYYFN